jgi:hypothetical protein
MMCLGKNGVIPEGLLQHAARTWLACFFVFNPGSSFISGSVSPRPRRELGDVDGIEGGLLAGSENFLSSHSVELATHFTLSLLECDDYNT